MAFYDFSAKTKNPHISIFLFFIGHHFTFSTLIWIWWNGLLIPFPSPTLVDKLTRPPLYSAPFMPKQTCLHSLRQANILHTAPWQLWVPSRAKREAGDCSVAKGRGCVPVPSPLQIQADNQTKLHQSVCFSNHSESPIRRECSATHQNRLWSPDRSERVSKGHLGPNRANRPATVGHDGTIRISPKLKNKIKTQIPPMWMQLNKRFYSNVNCSC